MIMNAGDGETRDSHVSDHLKNKDTTTAHSEPPLLEVRNLRIEYRMRKKVTPAVRGVDFSIHRGETLGLVGESGCGKSTVAYGVMGYMPRGAAAGGEVILNGRDMLKMSPGELREAWGTDVAMVYQDPMSSLNPSLTILDQLNEVLTLGRGLTKAAGRERSRELLEQVNIPDPEKVLSRYPHQLSGGMKQRVCIAMALAAEPKLMVMDEPTTALDVTTAAQVLDLLPPLREKYNLAVLYISHDLGVVARVCDRVGVMYAGRLVEEAPVRELYRNPRHPYTRGLFQCLPRLGETKEDRPLTSLPGRVIHQAQAAEPCAFEPRCRYAGSEECRKEQEGLRGRAAEGLGPLSERGDSHRAACDSLGWPDGRQETDETKALDLEEVRRREPADKPLLEAVDLKTHYNVSGGLWGGRLTLKAVDGVTFSLTAGQTLAVVGESGCGKSSLARTIVGLNKATGGALNFEGQPLAPKLSQRPRSLASLMSMVFQNPDSTLNPKHQIGYAISRPLQLNFGYGGKELHEATLKHLAMVNLGPDYAKRYPRELSGGEKQRVAIARALASSPGLMVCDEPTSALDVSVQASIIKLLLAIQAKLGLSYLFISHDLSVVRYLSDHIAIMYLGKFCETGTAAEVFADPAHPYTQALWSAISTPDPDVVHNPIRLAGSPPSLASPPQGCRFHTRCPQALGDLCRDQTPPAVKRSDSHTVHCHRYQIS